MSARAILVSSDSQSTEGKTSGWKLLTNGSAQAGPLGASVAIEPPQEMDDSARFVEELRRRYEAPYPLP